MVRFNYKFIRSSCVAVLIVCCLFSCLALVTYADDVVESSEYIEYTDFIEETSDIDNNYSNNIIIDNNLILTSFDTSIQSITASDTTGFKSIILQLIGPYEMLTKEYTYTNPSSNYQTKQVTTEPDYSWMISAAIFIIVLYCFLRILGGVICGRYY